MKVVIDVRLASGSSMNGTARYVSELVQALAARVRDWECRLLVSDAAVPDSIARLMDAPGGLSMPSLRMYVPRRLLQATWLAAGYPPLEYWSGPIDCIHLPWVEYVPTASARRLVTLHDIAFITHPEYYPAKDRWLHVTALRRALSGVRTVITNSLYTADVANLVLGVPAGRVVPIPLAPSRTMSAVPAATDASVRADLGVPSRYALFVGTIEPRKNLVRLVEAFDTARTTAHFEEKLVIVGRPGWLSHRIVAALRRAEEAGSAVWLGPVNDEQLPALIRGATAMVYPSMEEGYGLPVAEAMACGTPVIASDIDAIREVAGNAAILVRPTDTAAIADAIASVLKDSSLRSRLAVSGLVRMSSMSWDRVADLTEHAYRAAAEQ